jgi:hypothetical protein
VDKGLLHWAVLLSLLRLLTAGSNVDYTWNFGDGSDRQRRKCTTHSYAVDGQISMCSCDRYQQCRQHAQRHHRRFYGWTPMEEILIPAGSFQMGCDSSNPAENAC